MVSNTLLSAPTWFRGVDTFFEAFSILVAILIAVFSFKAYKLTKNRNHLYFGTAFGLISISFFAKVLTALFVYFNRKSSIVGPGAASEVASLFHAGRLVYVLLVLIPFLMILMIYSKLENKRMIAVFLSFLLVFAVLSHQNILMFYLVALLLVAFITVHLFDNYKERKSVNAGLIFSAFFMLVIQYVLFILTPYTSIFYAGAYFMQFLAYSTLLTALLRMK